jgi:hypothetical protein
MFDYPDPNAPSEKAALDIDYAKTKLQDQIQSVANANGPLEALTPEARQIQALGAQLTRG